MKNADPQSFYRILQLTENELEILNIFNQSKHETPASLSKRSSIPRPTIYLTLEKLTDRGLIYISKLGKRTVWKKADDEMITNNISQLKSGLLHNRVKYEKINITEDTDVTIYRGEKTILNLFIKLIDKHGGNRLMGIQGDRAGDSWKETFSLDNINMINKRVKEKGMITEIITSKNWFERQIEIFGKGWAENFAGRAAQVHFIDNKYLDYESQIFIFEDQVILASMSEALFIEVKNKKISKLLISLIRYIEDSSHSVDINKIIYKLIN
jgi:DNA-binding transcriptional ArsR family regulator